MPEALTDEAKPQLEARIYGLSLRLTQAKLLAEYQVAKGQYYEQSFDTDTGEWPMELAILP